MTAKERILLVEDNEGDILLTLKAMQKVNITNQVDVVRDGEQALDFLNKTGVFSDAETPGLILLDINLPKINGKEVLASIKKNEKFLMIPVIVLSTSDAESDIKQSYCHHANCFITKPSDFKDFMSVIEHIKEFWINIVRLPYKKQNEKGN